MVLFLYKVLTFLMRKENTILFPILETQVKEVHERFFHLHKITPQNHFSGFLALLF